MILLFFTIRLPSQKRKRPNCCPLLQVWALFRKMGIITDDVHSDEKHTREYHCSLSQCPLSYFMMQLDLVWKMYLHAEKSMNTRYTCIQKCWYYCGFVNSFDSAKDSRYATTLKTSRQIEFWKMEWRDGSWTLKKSLDMRKVYTKLKLACSLWKFLFCIVSIAYVIKVQEPQMVWIKLKQVFFGFH